MRVDAVRGLAPRTCEGGVPALAQGRGEYEFPVIASPNSRSLRASSQTGVAIPRIDVPLLMDEFRKTVQKNGLYDDKQLEIRRRFPGQ